tara:strand:+ start:84 stop:374 length:291 start_codon:yes stop_codon:yes gene_type:complete
MGQTLGVILGIGYVVIGILQWFATMDGLMYWFGISGIFAFFLSGFIAYIPLLGTIAGFKGAMDVWGWSFLEAGALFFGPFLIVSIISILVIVFERK